jgi:hypothetical protein
LLNKTEHLKRSVSLLFSNIIDPDQGMLEIANIHLRRGCTKRGSVGEVAMKIFTLLKTFIALLFLLCAGSVSYAEDMAYGWQLMTEDEIIEHRNKMRSFETNEEREAYRLEHHKLMQERAKEHGVTLPDTPLQRGKGMGPGGGKGMGPGGGKGGGMGGGQNP